MLTKLRAATRHWRVLVASLASPVEREQLGRLYALLVQVVADYEQGGLPALGRSIEPKPELHLESGALEQALAQIDALVAFTPTSRFRTCLRRAALRFYVLRSAGQAVALVIGVRRAQQSSQLDGHAWVEVAGQPFRDNDQLIANLTVMYRYPNDSVASV